MATSFSSLVTARLANAVARPATKLPHPQSTPAASVRRRLTSSSTRTIHTSSSRLSATGSAPVDSTNPALSFPCLDAIETRTTTLSQRARSGSGPEPSYTTGAHLAFHSPQPQLLDWGGVLRSFDIAYETWGTLNTQRTNAILLHTGLSASSHAAATEANPKPGWWQKFIGPGKPLDTDRFFVICTNVLGGCYGSTGPKSIDPANGQRYATRFPILTMEDMVRAQFRLLDGLGIEKLYASVGSSMGGMQSLAAATLHPERVGRVVSVSGCARSHPYSIAMRYAQRQVLMTDPHWKRGFYYDETVPPHAGMKLARQIATITYRSGPEWEARFGRRRADPSRPPALCPDFLIETYLDHAGEKWCLEYDANSFLYVSKAMDLFDLGQEHREKIESLRAGNAYKVDEASKLGVLPATVDEEACSLTLPEKPYDEVSQPEEAEASSNPNEPPADLVRGLQPMKGIPTLVLGVASDILFPAWQQREIAETLRKAGNTQVTHVELGEDKSLFGHDTFLLDLEHVGGTIGKFLN